MSAEPNQSAAEADIIRVLAELAGAASAPHAEAYAFQPAADARVMRQVARAAGPHAAAAVRLWRAVCAEHMRAAGLSQVLLAGGDPVAATEAARSFFGFSTPIVRLPAVRDALERALDSPGHVACLPWPEQAGPGQWWPMLNESRFRDLSILAGWPGFPAGEGEPACAMVGRGRPSASGNDETLMSAHDDSRLAERALGEAGLGGEVVARARSLALLKIPSFISSDDPRLELARRSGLEGLRIIGVRPCP